MHTIEGIWAGHHPPTRSKPYWVARLISASVDGVPTGPLTIGVRVPSSYVDALVQAGGATNDGTLILRLSGAQEHRTRLTAYRADAVEVVR